MPDVADDADDLDWSHRRRAVGDEEGLADRIVGRPHDTRERFVDDCDRSAARAIPIVRTTSPIGPFWRAKTCSMAARTFDLALFARATLIGMGRPGGFLRWMRERRP